MPITIDLSGYLHHGLRSPRRVQRPATPPVVINQQDADDAWNDYFRSQADVNTWRTGH